MGKTRATRVAALLLCVAASSVFARNVWHWTVPHLVWDYAGQRGGTDTNNVYFYLSPNNGAHSVAMTQYTDNNTQKVWTSILAERYVDDYNWPPCGFIRAYEFKDIGSNWNFWQTADSWPSDPGVPTDDKYKAYNCNTALNSQKKAATWGNFHGSPDRGRVGANDLTNQGTAFWPANPERLTAEPDRLTPDSGAAVAMCQSSGNESKGCAVFAVRDSNDDGETEYALYAQYTADGGAAWFPVVGPDEPSEIATYHSDDYNPFSHPSIASDQRSATMYLAFESTDATGNHWVKFTRSTDGGHHWLRDDAHYETRWNHAMNPCIAAVGEFVFITFRNAYRPGEIRYVRSFDGGNIWHGPDVVPLPSYGSGEFDSPNAACVPCPDDDTLGVLVVARLKYSFDGTTAHCWTTRGAFARFRTDHVLLAWWDKLMPLCNTFSNNSSDEPLNPSIAAIEADGLTLPLPSPSKDAIACFVTSTRPGYDGTDRRNIRAAHGYWGNLLYAPAPGANTARLLAIDMDGDEHYGCASWPYIATGQVLDGEPIYDFGANGKMPALALDPDGYRWATYVEMDTLWCHAGDSEPELVFAGSTSAVPGQPSIVCYPSAIGGEPASAVTFAVYDTAGATSRIMFARVKASGVVLDTIESANTLRDSFPCVSVYLSDSLVVTYQHGDSVLSRLLANYGPMTEGQPPAWSNANVVTASGYHPSSIMENGCVLNCVWASEDDGDLAVERATNDLSGGGMFGNWVAMTAPSAGSNVQKDGASYSGVGCSVWQQQVSGKWVIKGFVRGAETTLVANDTDAYSPYAVAESSSISPSISQVRVHLLYTAGVTHEVDEGIYDTGDVRFKTCSLSVSNAGPDATRANNGSKLMRKEAGDSLYAAYQDADGTVMYAYSAAGDSWRREVLATGRSYPAIAADSTGKRWVVARTADGTLPAAQYLYYQSGGSWASQSLYSGWDLLGPASLAGASSTTTGIAYTAFKVMGMSSQYIVLTKYNGTTVAACTVATGASFGDPSVAVEAYTADSDHVHVTWEDAGVVKYRMDTDGRSSGIANNWTAVVTLSDAQATSHHPTISADRDQIVAAWAQGATADIYYRKRSTASAYSAWDAALNLSNTANNASDWPTIAMGDTVVVGWEETRSAYDHDILACINFGDTLNVADNATVSGYPHILFQNKVSGDTAIPYLHCVWSETPSESYYEVAYNKLNLKQSTGEGQQSASSTPIPTKPSLTSCSPNPFRDRTQIRYALPTEGNVSLRVYDAAGRTVRTLASGHQKAGSYSVTWDSRDNRGRQVPRGVYFYRLDTPGFRSVKKAVVAR